MEINIRCSVFKDNWKIEKCFLLHLDGEFPGRFQDKRYGLNKNTLR